MSTDVLHGLPVMEALHSKEEAVTLLRGIADRIESGRYVLKAVSAGLAFRELTERVDLEYWDTENDVHKTR